MNLRWVASWRGLVGALLLVGPILVGMLELQGRLGHHTDLSLVAHPPHDDPHDDATITLDDIYVDVGAGIPKDLPEDGLHEEPDPAPLGADPMRAPPASSWQRAGGSDVHEVGAGALAAAPPPRKGWGGGHTGGAVVQGGKEHEDPSEGEEGDEEEGASPAGGGGEGGRDALQWFGTAHAMTHGRTDMADAAEERAKRRHSLNPEEILRTLRGGQVVPNLGVRSVGDMLGTLHKQEAHPEGSGEVAVQLFKRGNHIKGAIRDKDMPGTTLRAPYAGVDSPSGLHTQRFKHHFDELGFRERLRQCNEPLAKGRMPSLRNFPVSLYREPQYYFSQAGAGPHTQQLFDPTRSKLRWERCALVGNSGTFLLPGLKPQGRSIDRHDLVVRLNNAPSGGRGTFRKWRWVEMVGERTDVRMIGQRWAREYARRRAEMAEDLPLERNITLITVGAGHDEAAKLQAALERDRPDVTVAAVARRALIMSSKLVTSYRQCVRLSNQKRFHGGDKPTVGIIAAFILTNVCERLDVYGFGLLNEPHRWQGKSEPYNYFRVAGTRDTWRGPIYHKHAGEEHCPGAEISLLKAWALEGRLSFCDTHGCHVGRSMEPFLKPDDLEHIM